MNHAILWAAALTLAVGGCATRGAGAPEPLAAAATSASMPAAWHAPLPANVAAAAPGTDLARWWQQFDDPLVAALVGQAQAASPTIAAARSRIEQARAARVAAGAALLPRADASASGSRGRSDISSPLGNTLALGAQASWEIDLFGANAAARDAAQARLEGASAGWHDARTAVAAETASTYLSLRACEAQLALVERDAGSRAETARLTELSANAGFQAPASAAQARATATQQRAACESLVKALVALTDSAEPALRLRLAAAGAKLPQPAQIGVASVPAQTLAQRPDLIAAELELRAALADVAGAKADRLPRIALSGNVSRVRFSSSGFSNTGTLWSLGPLSISLPIFDGGALAAAERAAQARYEEAGSAYRGRVRNAVREVEDALIALQSSAARDADARIAADGFDVSYRATESRFKGGLASLFELEDARRTAIAAQSALIDLQRERVAAWITLYRAVGGAWSDTNQGE